MHEGLQSYKAEVLSNEILLLPSSTTRLLPSSVSRIMTFPRKVGNGYLLSKADDELFLWRWPYIITELARSSTKGQEVVDAGEFIPQNLSEYESILSPLMETLSRKTLIFFIFF